MKKFTVNKSLVDVTIDYIELEDETILIVEGIKDKEKFKEKIKTATAYFERSNWNNFNYYMRGCLDIDVESGYPLIDTVVLRDKKFRILLKKLIDGDGNLIKLDKEFFDNALPEFVIALMDEYDNKVEKEKNDILEKNDFIKKIIENENSEKEVLDSEDNEETEELENDDS